MRSTSASLVVGVGNRHRGDDAIGLLVAEACARRWPGRVEVQLAEGDLSDLMFRWRADQFVVIVDAVVSGRPAGTISTLDGLGCVRQSIKPLLSSHGMGVDEAIALAKLVDRTPAAITILGIEVDSCEHLAALSRPVASALPAAVATIGRMLDERDRVA